MKPSKTRAFWCWWCDKHGWELRLWTTRNSCTKAAPDSWECEGLRTHGSCGPRRIQLRTTPAGSSRSAEREEKT